MPEYDGPVEAGVNPEDDPVEGVIPGEEPVEEGANPEPDEPVEAGANPGPEETPEGRLPVVAGGVVRCPGLAAEPSMFIEALSVAPPARASRRLTPPRKSTSQMKMPFVPVRLPSERPPAKSSTSGALE
jgi:hypothetical protein